MEASAAAIAAYSRPHTTGETLDLTAEARKPTASVGIRALFVMKGFGVRVPGRALPGLHVCPVGMSTFGVDGTPSLRCPSPDMGPPLSPEADGVEVALADIVDSPEQFVDVVVLGVEVAAGERVVAAGRELADKFRR